MDTTKPCRHGHTTGRYKGGKCKGCHRARERRQSEARAAWLRRYRARDSGRVNDDARQRRSANRDLLNWRQRLRARRWLLTARVVDVVEFWLYCLPPPPELGSD
jgi:hypothetical protein